MASIFISYRRDDAGGHAGRLCDRLTNRFGDDRIFMDIEDIQPGQHFVRSIEERIGACDVVVAVIGPRWLEMLNQRAQEAEDFVRDEVRIALARNITVIPVLVGGAGLPQPGQLPAELSELSRRQAIEIRDDRFDDDVARLARALSGLPALQADEARTRTRRLPRTLRWAVPVALVAAIIGAFFAMREADSATSSAGPAAAPAEAVAKPADPVTPPADPTTKPAAARPADSAVRPAAPAIGGNWLADMQDSQQRPYRIRLRFVQTGTKIGGIVEYPTGAGAIHDAELDGRQLTFSTTHTPQFESEPATIRFHAEVNGDEIRLTSINDAGIATGIAKRIALP
jgi:hypothetical protein